ncbi:hypothetical protein BTH55_02940 [Lactobacillus delbrueckii subsp. bulgaricus]|nr:hypothetical protein [Lactobacillus delbrueckii subsp. bulgaricus]MBT8856873.1 hypothetical protein [Lactobacillus delbrueckii subsp. bulgaricus]MBT8866596.1 hypothetical protein [Lactobacillus delbrueckii subsp. bulgaricus]
MISIFECLSWSLFSFLLGIIVGDPDKNKYFDLGGESVVKPNNKKADKGFERLYQPNKKSTPGQEYLQKSIKK